MLLIIPKNFFSKCTSFFSVLTWCTICTYVNSRGNSGDIFRTCLRKWQKKIQYNNCRNVLIGALPRIFWGNLDTKLKGTGDNKVLRTCKSRDRLPGWGGWSQECSPPPPPPPASGPSQSCTLTYLVWRARVCWSLLCLCLDAKPESCSCRNKQVRYQLSHPSPYLATHLH